MSGRIWASLKRGEAPPGWGWLHSAKLVFQPRWAPLFHSLRLDSIGAIVTSPLGEIVSHDRKMEKNDVKRLALTESGQTRVFFVKRYYNYLFEKIWKRAFRGSWWPPSMVKTEYVNLLQLSDWGFLVPEPVAYGEQRFAGGLINAFLISLEIPQAMGLDYLLGTWLPAQPTATRRRVRSDLVTHLASLTRRMHDRGFEHHDFFLRNLMISGTDVSKLYLLDAPRGRRWPVWIARKRAVFDLATLDSAAPKVFRRSERLKFFLLYRGHQRLTAPDKAMIRKILKRAEPWRPRQILRLDRALHIESSPD